MLLHMREIHEAETAVENQMGAAQCQPGCALQRAPIILTTETVEEKEVRLQLMSARQRDRLAAEYLPSCSGPELYHLLTPVC